MEYDALLTEARKKYVGRVYVSGPATVMIQEINTPESGGNADAYGVDEGDFCLLVDICVLRNVKGKRKLPQFIMGYRAAYRIVARRKP